MNPTDYRNATWEQIQGRVSGLRAEVLAALREHGPCTTRQLARAMGWDLERVRPRVTELVQIGFAAIAYSVEAGASAREGIYRACSNEEAYAAWQATAAEENQLPLL